MKIIPVLFFALVGLVGCSTTSTQANTDKMTNSQLEQAVKNQLASNPELANDVKVSADADKNTVTLSGTVPSEAMRTQAISLAKGAGTGPTVDDKIDVKPAQ